ncbi:MAG: T9SS type A sorting domain-containing protein [Bacteroidetes bacterium]|nr:T9SS type A sorting domain-containing protein [Bacteroidota bacterium]
MKRIILFLLLCWFGESKAQQYLNNLAIDGRYVLYNDTFNFVLSNFKTGNPVFQYIDSADLLFGTVSALIADSTGQLIFYSNGYRIGNKNFEMISGTDTLDYTSITNNWPYGQPLLNGAFFLPSLSNTNEILLFHKDWQFTMFPINWLIWTSYNAWYTVLNKTMNNGLGGLVSRNNVLYNNEMCRDGIQAVKHANGRDYWIVLQDFDTSTFITFLYTPSGFYGPYFQNVNIPLYRGGISNSLFNRQGTKYATTAWNNNLTLFDFDRCSGQFTYTNQVDTSWQFLGAIFCFSPKGNKIYRGNYTEIYQYDTADVDFNITRDTVAIYDGYFDVDSTKFGTMFLAGDDKIYINASGTKYQHVINKPDLSGIACNLTQHSIKHPLYIGASFPNYINYDLEPLVGSPCDTLSVLSPALSKGEGVMQYFPNPATNEVNIKIKNVPLGNYTLSIYTPLANEVMHIEGKSTAKDFTKTLRVQSLAGGFYFVKLQVEGMEWYGRFVRE